jgi:2-polyprenyl-3-methyl-5-hydroxy-6-metoxy-1,4-benzoquinol methylase
MHYDPIKKTLGNVVGQSHFARSLFYHLLDLLLLRTWHIKHVLKKWAHNQQPELNVLDAGSGFGQYSFWLARKFKSWQITGVDVKQEQVDDCNAFFSKAGKHNVKFETGDLTIYKNPGYYNLILSVDVMEHIENDNAVFHNFYESLKPGGMLLISTPSDQGGSDVHDDNQTSFIEEHVRDGYNRLEIQEKLANAGFGRTAANYQYGRPGKISWKLSMKYPIKLLGVSKIFFIILPFYYLLVFPFCLILNYADVRINHKTGTGLIVRAWK